jgi:hypothetical protein
MDNIVDVQQVYQDALALMSTSYVVVTQYHVDELEREVERLLNDGWVLVGGVAMCYNVASSCIAYSQALVKYDIAD